MLTPDFSIGGSQYANLAPIADSIVGGDQRKIVTARGSDDDPVGRIAMKIVTEADAFTSDGATQRDDSYQWVRFHFIKHVVEGSLSSDAPTLSEHRQFPQSNRADGRGFACLLECLQRATLWL